MEERINIALRFVREVWNMGNLDCIENFVDDKCKLHGVVLSGTFQGVEFLKQHVRACRETFSGLHVTIDGIEARNDEVVLHWTASGTHQLSFLGIAATHRVVTASGTAILRFKGRKMIEQWVDWNTHALLLQLTTVGPNPRK